MRLTRKSMRPIGVALGCWLAMLFGAPAAQGNTIDVRLNIDYAINSDPLSGGTWSLEAKSGGAGILSLSLRLANIATAVSVAPVGVVNGTDEAGFRLFQNADFGTHRNVFIGQAPKAAGYSEQPLFYGVGTLAMGSPDYPDQPVGSMSIGPTFATLTNVMNVPWASDPADPLDMDWDLAATLLTGTFNTGVTPSFFTAPDIVSTGNVFTSVGTSSMPGTFMNLSPLTSTIVRTDLVSMMASADYNGDGFVNAADYTVWRNTVGSTTIFDADGSGPSGTPDGVIDQFDYDFWKLHYGEMVPGPGAGAAVGDLTVPEPSAGWLLVVGATLLAIGRARLDGGAGFQVVSDGFQLEVDRPGVRHAAIRAFVEIRGFFLVERKKATLELETA